MTIALPRAMAAKGADEAIASALASSYWQCRYAAWLASPPPKGASGEYWHCWLSRRLLLRRLTQYGNA
ncbi:hypothetical protein [Mitsuaria sp. GD03876]|uniref:hypothetical protein n=1 Tax=Mitsuaria sp. GD03876 TaxID=2975399 RepID=UPI002448D96D|nr:hypothetical protein [Mitsuaria sp. GD03876]MDH0866617.1 hypothetical protein [Mitsuaria sp. GD03876]